MYHLLAAYVVVRLVKLPHEAPTLEQSTTKRMRTNKQQVHKQHKLSPASQLPHKAPMDLNLVKDSKEIL